MILQLLQFFLRVCMCVVTMMQRNYRNSMELFGVCVFFSLSGRIWMGHILKNRWIGWCLTCWSWCLVWWWLVLSSPFAYFVFLLFFFFCYWGLFCFFSVFSYWPIFTWNWSFFCISSTVLCLCVKQPFSLYHLSLFSTGFVFIALPRTHIQLPIQRQLQRVATSLDPVDENSKKK